MSIITKNRKIIRVILLVLSCHSISSSTLAIIIEDSSSRNIEAGPHYLYLQGSTKDRAERISYHLTFHDQLPIFNYPNWLKFDASLIYSPDKSYSRSVDIQQDFYFLTATTSYECIKFFRYRFGIGPMYSIDYTTIKALNDTSSSYGHNYGLQAKFDIDYAFSKIWELRIHTGLFYRLITNQIDWFYGATIGWNF